VSSSDRSCSAARIVFGKSIINQLSKHFLFFEHATKRRCQRVSGVSSKALVFRYLVTERIRKRTKSRLFQQAAGPSVLILQPTFRSRIQRLRSCLQQSSSFSLLFYLFPPLVAAWCFSISFRLWLQRGARSRGNVRSRAPQARASSGCRRAHVPSRAGGVTGGVSQSVFLGVSS